MSNEETSPPDGGYPIASAQGPKRARKPFGVALKERGPEPAEAHVEAVEVEGKATIEEPPPEATFEVPDSSPVT